jgi:hypothetical protein
MQRANKKIVNMIISLRMKPRTIHLLLCILLLAPALSEAQNYTRNAGIRLGQTSGFTYRQYMDEGNAYEGLFSFNKNGLQLTLLKEFVQPYLSGHIDNIYLIWGYGAHLGTNHTNSWEIFSKRFYDLSSITPLFGIDGYAGVEYRIKEFPLLVGVDYKPFFDLAGAKFFSMSLWDFAFTLKYNF